MRQQGRRQETKQDPMIVQYKRACVKLLPGQQAVNEVIQMKPVRQARRRLMHKKAVALAAACMGIFACSCRNRGSPTFPGGIFCGRQGPADWSNDGTGFRRLCDSYG